MGHTRRDFIRRGITFVGAGLAAPRVLLGPSGGLARAGTPAAGRILVIVELAGGNDGLNTVAPYTESRYYSYRPRLALNENEILLITDELGLHPRMGGLKTLYDENRLAIVQGVGYETPNRSHFRSTEIWQTAVPDDVVSTGWLGRYLDSTQATADSSLEGIALGYETPATLLTTSASTASIASIDAYELQGDPHHPEDEANKRNTFAGLYDDSRGSQPTLDYLAGVGLTAFTSSQVLKESVASYAPAVEYPSDYFSQSMLLIAQIIGANLGTNVFYTSVGSFDTHANQPNDHANLLGWLSDGLSAFYRDLVAHGRGDDLLVMTFSEFGRRVDENSSLGTDHGAAAPLFVLGDAVKGGIYGDHPSLTTLGDGDLVYAIDFRAVYATVLQHWLNTDPMMILGAPFEDIGFL